MEAATAAIIAAIAASVGTGYAIYSGERGQRKAEGSKEEAERQFQQQQSAIAAEAARREEELRLKKEQLAAEAADRKALLDAEKAKLMGTQQQNLRTARVSLLATQGDVWETRPEVRQATLLGGTSPMGGKTLLGQ